MQISTPFFIKIHHKFMKNHQKTRFGNRLGKKYNFLFIFYTFWCPLGTLGGLPGHHFSSKMLRVCRPQALLDAFWWFLHCFYYPWNLWDHFGYHFMSICCHFGRILVKFWSHFHTTSFRFLHVFFETFFQILHNHCSGQPVLPRTKSPQDPTPR